MIKLKDLLKENPADYADKDADDIIKLLRRKQKYDQFDGVGATEAKGGTSIMKKWKDIPKKGVINFGTYGKYMVLSKNRLRVSGKFISGSNKGKKVIWYSKDGQKDYRKRKGLSIADTPQFPYKLVGIGESKND